MTCPDGGEQTAPNDKPLPHDFAKYPAESKLQLKCHGLLTIVAPFLVSYRHRLCVATSKQVTKMDKGGWLSGVGIVMQR